MFQFSTIHDKNITKTKEDMVVTEAYKNFNTGKNCYVELRIKLENKL